LSRSRPRTGGIELRVLIVDTCYPAFLARHYEADPTLADASYDAQWRALMDTFFGTSDAYSHNLAPLGVVAHEVVANCTPLQEAWLREHPARIPPGLPAILRQQEILAAQARWYEPDVVYVQNMRWVLDLTLRRLRRRARLLAGQSASVPPRDAKVRRYDIVLTSFPHFVARFERAGTRAAYLRLAFDERVHERLEAEAAPIGTRDAVFVGALNPKEHRGGKVALAAAAGRVPIEFWGYSVDGWPEDPSLRRTYRGEAWGLDMYRIQRSARVSLNRHGEIAEDNANNMRLFEATGVGTMLLTDAKRNLADLFEPGVEVATYDDVDDLVAKIAYYLEHEDARRAIAAAGRQRTLREHTYRHRIAELADVLETEIGRR